jgi:protein TonB
MWDAKPNSSIPAEIKEDPNKILSAMEVESKPEFPGGPQMFYSFVGKNYLIPDDERFKGGKVFASFVVEKDGTVTDVKILRDCGFGSGEQLKRVLLLSPKWKPAMQNNQPVRCMYTIPVTISSSN